MQSSKPDGTIDYAAKTGGRGEQTPIFDGGEYALTVTSAGYHKTLQFTANQSNKENDNTGSTDKPDTEVPANSESTSDPVKNPDTGVADVAVVSGAAFISALAAVISKKRK